MERQMCNSIPYIFSRASIICTLFLYEIQAACVDYERTSILNAIRSVNISCSPTYVSDVCYLYSNTSVILTKTDKVNFVLSGELPSFIYIKHVKLDGSSNITTHILPREIFERFPNLEKLTAAANIFEIQRDNFNLEHKLKLRSLDLSRNYLKTLAARCFFGAPNLFFINLNNNVIETIDDLAFDGLLKLRILWLAGNFLKTVNRIILPSLRELALNDNFIEEFRDGALTTPKLKYLFLTYNQLVFLPSSLFNATPELQILHADHNIIQRLHNALDGLQNLIELKLDHNHIDDLNITKLARLPKLVSITLKNSGFNLDHVNISESDINSTDSNVEYLDLSSNKLENGTIFAKLKVFPKLRKIDLSNNQLRSVDLQAIRSSGLSELTLIKIAGRNLDHTWWEHTVRNLSMTMDANWNIVITPLH